MIKEINEFKNSLGGKSNWGAKELGPKLQSLSDKISKSLKEEGRLVNINGCGLPKMTMVNTLKKYDIVYISLLGGMPHYYLIYKVDDKRASGLCVTSTYKESNWLHTIKNDRIFEGSFIANTLLSIDITEAKSSFVRTYEDKREAGRIFKKMIKFYETILNN